MGSSPPSPQTTERVQPAFVQSRRQELTPTARVALLLIHPVGVEVVELHPGTTLTVGREPPADVCIADSTLSRCHASFRLDGDGARFEVIDLDSTNGTWRAGERITALTLPLGEELMLGGVLARVRLLAAAPAGAGDHAAPIGGAAMATVLELCRRVAASRLSVILQGETGTGKEVLASYIHDRGPAAAAPMISVNCGAIPKDLVESTFFGHEKGAFTGAHQAQPGLFESAAGGTVFLDEIAELPLPAQAALLRVLETRRVTRVGGTQERGVDVRVLAASHRDLGAMVEAGAFRADLFFRLSTMTIEIPPLRRRPEDVEPLALHFLRLANRTHGRHIDGLTPRALERVRAYGWPGNVRELRNVIERAVVLAEADLVDEGDLPARLRGEEPAPAPTPATSAGGAATVKAEAINGGAGAASGDAGQTSAGLRARVQAYEAEVIREALAAAGGRRADAARLLGMPLRTLAHKIKLLGIDED